jgi:aminopeptidase N
VKLEYKWSDQQLTFLMRHARNDFSRWDAAQSLLATYIKLNVNRHQQGQPLSLPVHVADAFRAILLDEKIDPALAAEILTLPSANEIAELFAIIDPIAIAAVREALTRTLANELADEFLAVYNANKLTAIAWSTPISVSVLCAIPACAIWRLATPSWRISWSRPVSPGG